jgi:hypothetical protein
MNWYSDVPKFPACNYRISVAWSDIERTLARWAKSYDLDLNPDFQRGHVWTEAQQIAFVEYALRVPTAGLEIYFNHPHWMGSFDGHFQLVDGKQRLEAARRFIANEIPACGHLCKNIVWPRKHDISDDVQFYFNIASLLTRAEVLNWYLNFNSGGTPHAQEEIARVRELLEKENECKVAHQRAT